ncbi:pseudouridine-5'-phosphatase isoform X4 [Panulirus ornatus]|uniref:pseudouridine-5'-phosphatase isoform X4 n=1 Tax=Panulirus ornatus TaxID=150431 RepID=UPI003A850564
MSSCKPVTHVIFDMDGLLLDTESLCAAANESVIQPYGKVFTWELNVAQMGQKAESCAQMIINHLQIPLSVEDYVSQVSEVHKKIMPTAQLMPDTERLYTKAAETVASEYGKVYTWEMQVNCMGLKAHMDAQYNIESLDLPITVDQYLDKVSMVYKHLFPNAQFLPDTERLYTEATQAIASQYNKVYTWEIKVQCMGMKGPMAAQHIIDSLELPLTVDQYLGKISSQYDSLFPNARLLPGAEKVVRHLHKHNIPIAIASGGAQDSFELKTTNHKEFVSMFSHVVLASTDPEVKNGKPAPDVFLICASRFSNPPKPEQCLVFEDAPNGVTAGVTAGMQVVMVPDPRLDAEMTKGASQVLKSLEDFKPELFGLPSYDC